MTGRLMPVAVFVVAVFVAALLHVCDALYRPERVVNGQPTEEGDARWQVSLQTRGRHFCGGSLVHGNWVVTAAHCAKAHPHPRDVRVQLGVKVLGSSSPIFKVTKIIPHPKFNDTTLVNDIALIKIDMSDTARTHNGQSIRTETNETEREPENCTVTGYGTTSFLGPTSDGLQKAKIETWRLADCQYFYGSMTSFTATIDEGHICAGGGDTDSCQGDSGGPLVCCTEDTLRTDACTLRALVSWGIGCAQEDFPGVYTKVAHYNGWMQSVISRFTDS